MRRKPGALLPLEVLVLEACAQLRTQGIEACHGFLIAKAMRDIRDARLLTAHGTLYRALGRLAEAGLLSNAWEDPQTAAQEGRPRRRLYRLTATGEQALAKARSPLPSGTPRLNQRRASA